MGEDEKVNYTIQQNFDRKINESDSYRIFDVDYESVSEIIPINVLKSKINILFLFI